MTFRTAPSRPVLLINLSSSSSEDISGQITTLLERYGYGRPKIFMGQSADMADMMQNMRDAGGDLLISFGGDGTAAAVASIARDQDVPFIALPGGTMNMLMLGLYGSDVWQDCLLGGLAAAQPRPMTAGVVSDDRGEVGTFMVGAMFGKPTRMNDAREELRDGHVVEAARDAIKTMRTTSEAAPITIATDDAPFGSLQLELVNVTCPFMDGEALDPDVLDLTLFETVTGGSTLSLGLSALLGNIRQSESVEHVRTQRFRLRSDDPIEGLLDGESMTFEGDVSVRIDRQRGLVMAPWPAMSFPTQRQTD
ncbi:diacylglycerol/lipid kinase family protein [Algimonas porphyrae]|uniref:diacylglycerol/lipid kinase family protein n=1 Tax=Algimonas porphyrae TaxID=1128113 RepID=UPI0024E057D7|nr:diacylglycerol kinase family protein [Algimonas porphyrae]